MHTLCKQLQIGDTMLQHTCSSGRDAQHSDCHFRNVLQGRILQAVVSPEAKRVAQKSSVVKDPVWDVVLSLAPVLQLRDCCVSLCFGRHQFHDQLLSLDPLLHWDGVHLRVQGGIQQRGQNEHFVEAIFQASTEEVLHSINMLVVL